MPKTKLQFVYVTYINTTPRELWRALTDPGFIRQYWLGRENTSTWKKGAGLESRSPEGELEWDGRIIESKPPRRLVYTFRGSEGGEAASRVAFEIETLSKKSGPQGGALRLTVTHDRFPPRSKVFPGICEGWPVILSGLKTLLESGRGLGMSWKF
jgi:uncharacterized protein YndB with AHSA1/START domain